MSSEVLQHSPVGAGEVAGGVGEVDAAGAVDEASAWTRADRTLRVLAVVVGGIVLASIPPVLVEWRVVAVHAPHLAGSVVVNIMTLVLLVAVTVASVLILQRQPRQLTAWLLLAQCFLVGPVGIVDGLADIGYYAEPGSIPGPGVWADVSESATVLNLGVLAGLLLVFPSGRRPEGRSRLLVWPVVTIFPLWFIERFFRPGPFAQGDELAHQINPLGVSWLGRPPWHQIGHLMLPLAALTLLAVMASFAWRVRHSHGDERQQLKIVGLALIVPAFALVVLAVMSAVDSALMPAIGNVVWFGLVTLIPIAVIVAISRYRLYDVDLVVNRTLVYGSLSIVLTSVYVVAVFVVGRVVVRAGLTSPWAVAVATLAAAAAAAPARTRIQHAVDRTFSRRAWDAQRQIDTFAQRWRDGPPPVDALRAVLSNALRDPTVELRFWLREQRRWADEAGGSAVMPSPDEGRSVTEVTSAAGPVAALVHDAGLDRNLAILRAVTASAALLLDNARLRAEAFVQLAEVQASRRRIVAAGDAERRRVERDLHDGAQQRLVALALRTKLAARTVDDAAAQKALDALAEELHQTLRELRELARGIHPAALEHGIAAAVEQLATRLPVHVELDLPARRYAPALELTTYYVVCEALTNAVKHADTDRVSVAVSETDGHLVVSVRDHGRGGARRAPGGGLDGLADRVAVAGGTLVIASTVGAGTAVTVELPCTS